MIETIQALPEHLREAVLEELADPDFSGWKHYSRVTQHSGCRGPLCARAARIYQKQRREKLAYEQGKTRKKYRRRAGMEELDRLMDEVGSAYLAHRELLASA